jgi:hypothetical protein
MNFNNIEFTRFVMDLKKKFKVIYLIILEERAWVVLKSAILHL